MSSTISQPNLTDGLSLIGWRLKRDAEIRARINDVNFECEVEPSSTSYAAFEQTTDDLCLEVDAIDLNEYDPYGTFVRLNSCRTPLIIKSHQYNFAEDDTPVKYPLAIEHPKKPPSHFDDQDKDIAPDVMQIDDFEDKFIQDRKRFKSSSNESKIENHLQLGDLRVFLPKLHLRFSNVNINHLKLPSIPNYPNKIH